jgi:hypothetical protein
MLVGGSQLQSWASVKPALRVGRRPRCSDERSHNIALSTSPTVPDLPSDFQAMIHAEIPLGEHKEHLCWTMLFVGKHLGGHSTRTHSTMKGHASLPSFMHVSGLAMSHSFPNCAVAPPTARRSRPRRSRDGVAHFGSAQPSEKTPHRGLLARMGPSRKGPATSRVESWRSAVVVGRRQKRGVGIVPVDVQLCEPHNCSGELMSKRSTFNQRYCAYT